MDRASLPCVAPAVAERSEHRPSRQRSLCSIHHREPVWLGARSLTLGVRLAAGLAERQLRESGGAREGGAQLEELGPGDVGHGPLGWSWNARVPLMYVRWARMGGVVLEPAPGGSGMA